MAKRSYDEIQAEILKLQQEAEEARSEERNEAIKRIRADMEHFGITADELRGAVPSGRGTASGKIRAAAAAEAVAPVATCASDDSPAVRMLEEAGIDFRRKSPALAPPLAPAKRPGKKIASAAVRTSRPASTKGAPRKTAAKGAKKATSD